MNAILMVAELNGNYNVLVPAMISAFILFAFIRWVKKVCRNFVIKSGAKVNLKKKEAIVSLEKEVSEEQLRKAVEEAGYKVTEIRS